MLEISVLHNNKYILIYALCGFFLLCSQALGQSVVVPQAASPNDHANGGVLVAQYPKMLDKYERDFDLYFLELLRLALDKSKIPYVLEGVELPVMVESRSAEFLKANQHMVHWLNASGGRENTLIPIKVPLFKGLIGWRIFFIRAEDQAKFLKVKTKAQLAQFVAGQGHDWPDTQVLKDNGLKVRGLPSWRGLFEMLSHHRIDYFPRSIIEVERELRLFESLGLYVETSLVIRYPAAYYFFVNSDNKRLANAIEIGLKQAITDGDFDLLFNRHFSGIIQRARLSERTIIPLSNRIDFPVAQEDLWFNPSAESPLSTAP